MYNLGKVLINKKTNTYYQLGYDLAMKELKEKGSD